jgi:glucosylceramidase
MRNANPNFKLVGTAWSAPGWMKTGNKNDTRKGVIGGTLANDSFSTYAKYLAKLINTYEGRDIPFDAITM